MTTTENVESAAFRVTITTSIEIDAPAATVWAVLTDTAAYPQWNSFIRRWEGELGLGERQLVRIEPTDASGQTFRPRIVDLQPGRELTWLGRVGLPGVLDGRHRYAVESIGADRSRLVQAEVLSGALVPLFRRMLTVDTPAAFSRMNAELAARAVAS
jgi:hypothetical protein